MKRSCWFPRTFATVGAILLFAGVLSAQVTTTTALTGVSPASSTLGQTVTLNAGVSPAGATGTVTFMDGAVFLGVAALDLNGAAHLSTVSLSAGSHSLRAVY